MMPSNEDRVPKPIGPRPYTNEEAMLLLQANAQISMIESPSDIVW